MKKLICFSLVGLLFISSAIASNFKTKNFAHLKKEKSSVAQKRMKASDIKTKVQLIHVTIETTCGLTQEFDFQPAPDATQESMEELLAEEASGWNMLLCDEFVPEDEWQFSWQ